MNIKYAIISTNKYIIEKNYRIKEKGEEIE